MLSAADQFVLDMFIVIAYQSYKIICNSDFVIKYMSTINTLAGHVQIKVSQDLAGASV